jgi:coenzyme F420-reducing hydrogenase alpha subunit
VALKLSKDEQKKHQELAAKLREAFEELNAGIGTFNDTVNTAWQEHVAEKLTEYNTLAQEANEFTGEVHDRLENEFADKSEKWQAGEKGEEASNWIVCWEQYYCTDLSLDEPEDVDLVDGDEVEAFEALGAAPEEG